MYVSLLIHLCINTVHAYIHTYIHTGRLEYQSPIQYIHVEMRSLLRILQSCVQQYIDEVAAGLVGQHHAGLQLAGSAQLA